MKSLVVVAALILFCSVGMGNLLEDDIATVGLWHFEEIYYDGDDIPWTGDDDSNNAGRDHDLVLFRSGLNETPPTIVAGYDGNALLFEGGQFANCPSFWSSSYDEIVVDYMIYISAVPSDLGAATTYMFTSSVFEMGLWPGSGGAETDYMRLKIRLSSGELVPQIVVGDLKDRWLRVVASYDDGRNLVFSITDTTTGIERRVTDTGGADLRSASGDLTFGSTSPSLGSKPSNRNFRGMIDELKITHLLDVPHYAYNPLPADNSTIIDMPEELSWSKGLVAAGSDIYFDTNAGAVENTLKLAADIDGSRRVDLQDAALLSSQWQTQPTYPCADTDGDGVVDLSDLLTVAGDWLEFSDAVFLGSTVSRTIEAPALAPETTYYWRAASVTCDEIDAGNIWRFTTGSAQSSDPDPTDGESNAAVNDNHIALEWTGGFGADSFDVYFGTSSGPAFHETVDSATAMSPALLPDQRYYWRVDSVSGESTTPGAEWSFTTGTTDPFDPSPGNDSEDVRYPFEGVELEWSADFEPGSYNVYFGTDNPPAFYTTTTEASIMSPAVKSNTTYYWQIESVGPVGTVSGPVWQFTTATPAFPTAEGFGRFAQGGRGGSVYHVTNLNDSGAGSLRDAVSQSDRTIVFDVGGQIMLSSRLGITQNRLTIAGQTAPGDGISIVGPGISIGADDLIMRFLRVRYTNNSSQDDALSLNDTCSDDIFDHLSVSWGTDEVFSMNHSQNITAQWCMITESQNVLGHSKGSLLEMPVLSMHHCLYAHNNDRNPKNKGEFDYRNNVAYDWGFAPYIAGGNTGAQCHANCIGNYYIAGASTTTDDGIMVVGGNANYHLYFDDNRIDSNRNGLVDGVDLGIDMLQPTAMPDVVSTPFDFPPVATDSPQLAYQRVLSRVGCSIVRDEVDVRVIDQVVNETGGIIYSYEDVGGPGVINGGTAPVDTDQDGMPDMWEDAIVGLDSMVPDNNGDLNGDGYTNLEDYLNFLAGPYAMIEMNESVDINLGQYTSHFDAGTFTVSDAAGGIVVLLGDGHTARFTPDTDFVGLAEFTYTIDNGTTLSEVVNLLVSSPDVSDPTTMIQEGDTGFCSVDGSIDSNNAGYTGIGFANTDNAVGNGINWSVNITTSGTYTIAWRYANGSSDRPGDLRVDGSVEVSDISFPGTGDWTSWGQASTDVFLEAGVHVIRLEATSSGGLGNIDYIMLSGSGAEAANCP